MKSEEFLISSILVDTLVPLLVKSVEISTLLFIIIIMQLDLMDGNRGHVKASIQTAQKTVGTHLYPQ
jgi:hypothetical protein